MPPMKKILDRGDGGATRVLLARVFFLPKL
jgi:hypothetical protein